MENQEKLVSPGIRMEMPLLPLRGMTAFPGMLLSFDVERPFSVAALNTAMNGDRLIFLTAQKDITTEAPEASDLYAVGVVCRMRQTLRLRRGDSTVPPASLPLHTAAVCGSEPSVPRAQFTLLRSLR